MHGAWHGGAERKAARRTSAASLRNSSSRGLSTRGGGGGGSAPERPDRAEAALLLLLLLLLHPPSEHDDDTAVPVPVQTSSSGGASPSCASSSSSPDAGFTRRDAGVAADAVAAVTAVALFTRPIIRFEENFLSFSSSSGDLALGTKPGGGSPALMDGRRNCMGTAAGAGGTAVAPAAAPPSPPPAVGRTPNMADLSWGREPWRRFGGLSDRAGGTSDVDRVTMLRLAAGAAAAGAAAAGADAPGSAAAAAFFCLSCCMRARTDSRVAI